MWRVRGRISKFVCARLLSGSSFCPLKESFNIFQKYSCQCVKLSRSAHLCSVSGQSEGCQTFAKKSTGPVYQTKRSRTKTQFLHVTPPKSTLTLAEQLTYKQMSDLHRWWLGYISQLLASCFPALSHYANLAEQIQILLNSHFVL